MTQTSTFIRWTKIALTRIGAGLALGLVASSFITVSGHGTGKIDAASIAASARCEDDATCTGGLRGTARKPAAPVRMTKNHVTPDKPDDGAYFTEASHDPRFDPCRYADGRPYLGKGTVLNPHADFTGCLPKVASASDSFIADETFEVSGGGDAAGTIDPGTNFPDVFGIPGPVFGPVGTGGLIAIPTAQIVTGIPTVDPGDQNVTDPPTDPVPLPAPALLFLTGFAGFISLKRRKASH